MTYNNLIRKIVLTGVLILLLVGVFFVVSEFLKSTVEISSETNTNIKVYVLPENKEVEESIDKDSHVLKLSRGSYTLEISSADLVTKKTINVGFRNSLSFDITPEGLKSLIKTSDQKVSSIGVFNNEIVGLNNTAPVLVNEAGEIVYDQYESPIDKVIYANSTHFGEIRKNGDFSLTKNSIPRVLHTAKLVNQKSNPVVDADYNAEMGEFCLLLENGFVKVISLDGTISQGTNVDQFNNVIRCRGEVTVSGTYAKFSDGDNKVGTTPGELDIYSSGAFLKKIESIELNAVEINGDNVLYTDNKIVYSYSLSNDTMTEVQTIESLSNSSIYVSDSGATYIFDEDSVWSLDINESISKKIASGFNFRSVNSVSVDLEKNVIFSLDSRSSDSGIYSFTNNKGLSDTESKLRSLLPKKTYFYSADYTVINKKIIIEVAVFGDIPSTQQSREIALAKAREFISNLPIDSSVEVIYR